MHNALQQTSLSCGSLSLSGFSISGLATYLQVPELDVCFDMGECPLSAVPLTHVLLTHAHGDHARCILRHRALRGMLGIPGEPTYFMPSEIADDFRRVAMADAAFEGVPTDAYRAPDVVAMEAGAVVPLPHRKNTVVHAFDVDHRGVPSRGYTILERRKKLLEAYAGLPGPEIARLRREGIEVSRETDRPLITFIGDCVASSLRDNDSIWLSPVLVIEATFVAPEDVDLAAKKGHTHLREIGLELKRRGPDALPDHIVLKHFSMKVSMDEIRTGIQAEIPAFALDRIRVLA